MIKTKAIDGLTKGTLFLFPCPIVEGHIETIPQYVIDLIHSVDIFVAERAKTTRRYLKQISHPTKMQDILIIEMDKRNPYQVSDEFVQIAKQGKQIGVISEAGTPGIADPGSSYVKKAYQLNMQVRPMVGPSSILLALMASGMNGQNFAFNGYLPQQKPELTRELKRLESIVRKTGQSQIFIETPYRNRSIVEVMFNQLSKNTYLCIAVNITGDSEYIQSKYIDQWQNTKLPDIHKIPAIYIIGK